MHDFRNAPPCVQARIERERALERETEVMVDLCEDPAIVGSQALRVLCEGQKLLSTLREWHLTDRASELEDALERLTEREATRTKEQHQPVQPDLEDARVPRPGTAAAGLLSTIALCLLSLALLVGPSVLGKLLQ